MTHEKKTLVATIILALLAFGSLANGLWMLSTPLLWYNQVPAKVPDFGPYNEHFLRDIGCAYMMVGFALAWAARSVRVRLPLVVVGGMFHGFHALLHVYDTARAFVDHSHWLLDLPTVYLPAVLLIYIGATLVRDRAGQTGPPSKRSDAGSM